MGERGGGWRRAAISGIGVLGTLAVLALAGGAAPAASQESGRPAGSWLGLASDNGVPSIDPFDTLTLETAGFGPGVAGLPDGALPAAVAFAPDGRTAYIADLQDDGGILVVDTQALTVTGSIPLGAATLDLAVSADGSLVVATVLGRGVVVVNPATATVVRDIALDPVDTIAESVAIAPDGSQVYVTRSDGGLDIFDPATAALQFSLVIPAATMATVTPDGSTVFVVSALTEEVIGIDPRTGFERSRSAVEAGLRVYASPNGGPVVVTSVIQYEDDSVDGFTSDVDAVTGVETRRVLQDVPTPFLTFTPDGARLVGQVLGQLSLSVIDRATFEQGDEVPHQTNGLAIAPDQAPVAVLVAPSVTGLGSDTVLDASGSFSPTGSIVRWDWDFGDGTTVSTTEPVVHHRYEHPGAHTVRVTVTNSAGTSTEVVHTGKQVLRNGGPSAIATATAEVRGLAATGVDPSATVLLVGALLALGAALGAASVRRSAPRNRA
ncbi:PKD domain-containing protein [Agromyces larvae]|uniref:PKD domain-containing protein n=1 Tax=Agromyces larvae TaxID=2929802 RepID=A0ABY4C265_9MICO|nr:PKD domain-containing protein [Agromyces larvae]UOE45532.1 PKD domain-containing protein [Agromyces larvae]